MQLLRYLNVIIYTKYRFMFRGVDVKFYIWGVNNSEIILIVIRGIITFHEMYLLHYSYCNNILRILTGSK